MLKNTANEIKQQVVSWTNDFNQYKANAYTFGEKLSLIQVETDKETRAINALMVKISVTDSKLENSKDKIKDLRDRIDQIHETIVKIEDRKNTFLDLEKKLKLSIKQAEEKIAELTKELKGAKKDFDCYSYWVKGFKEIRLMLMIDALKEFEVSINNNLNKLGLGDWDVKLDVDQETKSGTVRKGFSVLVESPDHNGVVPSECWAGGEGQRLRLAGTLGLMDLTRNTKRLPARYTTGPKLRWRPSR